jgi:hypothetical protein
MVQRVTVWRPHFYCLPTKSNFPGRSSFFIWLVVVFVVLIFVTIFEHICFHARFVNLTVGQYPNYAISFVHIVLVAFLRGIVL